MAYLEYIFLRRSATGVAGHISDWAISLHSQSFHRDRHHFTCQHRRIQDISVLCRKKGWQRAKSEKSSGLVQCYSVIYKQTEGHWAWKELFPASQEQVKLADDLFFILFFKVEA